MKNIYINTNLKKIRVCEIIGLFKKCMQIFWKCCKMKITKATYLFLEKRIY